MKKNLIIFGISDYSETVHYYFATESEYKIVAFSVDRDYLTQTEFCGLPVVAFDELVTTYPPSDYDLFVAMGYSGVNKFRKEKYDAIKKLGYYLPSFISKDATVKSRERIGDNCFVFDDCAVQPFVTIGNNVTLWCGVFVGHHSTVHDHCYVGPHAVIGGGCVIQEQCFIGLNATLRDHLTVGKSCVVGAGTLLLADAEAEGLYIGSPTPRSPLPSSQLRKI